MSSTIYFSELSKTTSGSTVQLWSYTNGVAAEVRQINAGPDGDFFLQAINGQLYFEGWTSTSGDELWTSNGTATGTYMVEDLYPGATGSYPSYLVDCGGELLFTAQSYSSSGAQLFASNGTASGTINLEPKGGTSYAGLYVCGSYTYFWSDGGSNTDGLWESNGTSAGTHAVDELEPSLADSDPYYMTYYDGYVYYNDFDGESGYQLYRTPANGVTNQAGLFDVINPTGSSFPDGFCEAGAYMFFEANDGVHGEELWATNGSSTYMVKDINVSSTTSDANDNSNPYDMVYFAGECYFVANDGLHSYELWKSDGTSAGTQMISATFQKNGSSILDDLCVVGSTLYFAADDGIHGRELWSYVAGAAAPTTVFNADGTGNSHINNMTEINGALYFTASTNGGASYNLYETQGANTSLVATDVQASPNMLAATWGSVKDDFFNSGSSSVLFNNGGQLVEWEIKDGQLAGVGSLGGYGGGFSVAGTGDFYGNGTADVLMFNSSTGQLYDFVVKDGSLAAGSSLGYPGPSWSVAGIGDFYGTGTSDILLLNASTQSVVEYQMSNGAVVGAVHLGSAAGYKIVGTGDFNGDGASDILFENGAGQIVDWEMKNGGIIGANIVGTIGGGFNIVGTGDFFGNGVSDILFQNASTGEVEMWQMSNGAFEKADYVGNAFGYSVVGTGDYHGVGVGGSGTSDILFENSSGRVVDWQMQNGSVIGDQVFGTVGSGWKAS